MLIISDLHFGANIENRLEQFSVLSRSKEFNPESLVIIPGDLMTNYTKIFSETEFKKAENFIKELICNGVSVVCTLGNHDIELVLGSKATENFTDLFNNHIYKQSSFSYINSNAFDSIMIHNCDIFISLTSVHSFSRRRIKESQIDWVIKELEKITNLRDFKLHLVTHVSLWHGTHSTQVKTKRIQRELLSKYPFHSVIHGHNHEFVYAKRNNPNYEAKKLVQISVPTIAENRKSRGCGYEPGYVSWINRDDEANFISISELEKNFSEL